MFENDSRVTRPFATRQPVLCGLDLSEPVGDAVAMTPGTEGPPTGERWREDPATRLGELVRRRRYRLGWTQQDVVDHGGPSIVTLRQVELAKLQRPQGSTLTALDRALGWEEGSARGIWTDGKEPVALMNPRREPEISPQPVSAGPEDGRYVADRGPNDPPARISDEELLAVIRRQRQELDELEARIRGDRPVEGA